MRREDEPEPEPDPRLAPPSGRGPATIATDAPPPPHRYTPPGPPTAPAPPPARALRVAFLGGVSAAPLAVRVASPRGGALDLVVLAPIAFVIARPWTAPRDRGWLGHARIAALLAIANPPL